MHSSPLLYHRQLIISEPTNVRFTFQSVLSSFLSAIKRPSLDALVDIANALDVSTDDLLVDSLMHSTSTSNSEIHRLLLDCNEIEQEILTRMVREMKAILYGLGI